MIRTLRRGVLLAAMLLLTRTAAGQTWEPLGAVGPSPRRNAAAIYDPAGHRVVLFGGRDAGGDRGDVWALDLSTEAWAEITPDEGPAPAARFTHNADYDAAGHRVLIWSGRILNAEDSSLLNDVWAFDLAAGRWQQLEASTDPPVARYGTAAVFDPAGGSLVTFAGFTTQGRFDDTWRFDSRTRAWTEVAAAGARPGQRCLHTAAYDRRRHRMIIFGGQRDSESLDDAWALDLAAETWIELAPAPMTGGLRFPASAYDPVDDRFLVFGGEATDGTKAGDLWALDLAADTWSLLESSELRWDAWPLVEGPEPRDGAVLVYVPGEARLVMFGGTGSAHLGDTWTFALRPPPAAVAATAGVTPAAMDLQAFPNPFNVAASIAVTAPAGAALALYDALGRRVRSLGRIAGGSRVLTWDGTDDAGRKVASGVYTAVLHLASTRRATRVVLLR